MVALSGRSWRLAPALEAAWREANGLAPGRSKRSDGSIGDAAHRARSSRHNPEGGFVHALDLTHDPSGGFDAHGHARSIAARRDPRVRLLISRGQVWDRARGWRRYSGSNPHDTHVHIEVQPTSKAREDTAPWFAAVPLLVEPEIGIDPQLPIDPVPSPKEKLG